ncbi:hypothetical protein CLG85_001670 [Yangia mangrovi]|uniref:Uncharacterized protein n=1 Tax=Alloyangia mangrovi TaxID=1779329 RepID=A0A2A3K300_9RHOB|nr:hypothetical protein [Alloyangia mangrovi]MCT4369118.1 hypothetical protein [Alloyangia mangrovi]
MLLLKISYAIAFLAAAVCAVLAVAEGELFAFTYAVQGFIAGSLIAGLDRVVTLLTPVPTPAPAAQPQPPLASTEARTVATPDPDELDKRIAAAKLRHGS